jgi:hypothetical protein
MTVIGLAGIEYNRWPLRFVGTIGVMLRLKANTGTLRIGDPLLADN